MHGTKSKIRHTKKKMWSIIETNQSSDPNPGIAKILELSDNFKITTINVKSLKVKDEHVWADGDFNREVKI